MILSMAKTLLEKLDNMGVAPEQPLHTRKQLSVSERKAKYMLSFSPEMDSCTYKIDGNIIKGTTSDKCDYVILASCNNRWAEVFVELKGSDISHAITQLKQTITNSIFQETQHSLRWARVVTPGRIPSNAGNSIVERAKVYFKKKKCEFRINKSMQRETLKKTDFKE